MANFYISYREESRELAKAFSLEFKALNHVGIYEALVGKPSAYWQHVYLQELASADGVVALLTRDALASTSVMGEIGATRALYQARRRPLLLPVIIGDIPESDIPEIVKDVFFYRLRSNSDTDIKSIVVDINRHYYTARSGFPKIFISHRHAERTIVEALVKLLTTAFDIQLNDLRATSVRPYNLRWGAVTPDRLREELQFAEAVIGIISPDSKGSSYVLFELGASWGRGLPSDTSVACSRSHKRRCSHSHCCPQHSVAS
jgi:TIR domain